MNKVTTNVRMKRLIVVKIEMLKNTNRYQLLKKNKKTKKHASVKALVYPSNLVEIYQTTVCRRGREAGREGGIAGCKPNVIKSHKNKRHVWRDLNNILSPSREARLFFFSTTKWHTASIPSSLSAVKPMKHIKAHCSAKPNLRHTTGCFDCVFSSNLLS